MDSKHRYFLVFLIALLASLCFQGSRGLYDRDETRYAECAREMLVSHSWLVPLRDFHPHLTKPPFTYWAIASSFKIFGINEWGARFPNALAFSITVVLVGLIAANLFEPRHGPWASMIYLSSIVPFAAANIVTTDTILVMWEVSAIWAFIKGWRAKTKNEAYLWFTLMALFWGMGFLTKGPAIFPVAFSLGIFWFLNRHSFKVFPANLLVITIFLIVGFSWYLIIWKKYPWSFDLIIKEQVTGRLFSDMFHRNSVWYAPFYLYLPMILLGCFPWAIFFYKSLKKSFLKKRNNIKQHFLSLFQEKGLLFIFLWWLVPLIIFSLAKSRLPLYILPVFPPMAIAIASFLDKKELLAPPFLNHKVLATLLCFVALKGLVAIFPMPQDARAMYKTFETYIVNEDDIDTLTGQFLDGLAFYSKKSIEHLPKEKSRFDKFWVDSSWEEELEEISSQKREVFVLKNRKDLTLLKQKGLEVKPLKTYHSYLLLEVRPSNG